MRLYGCILIVAFTTLVMSFPAVPARAYEDIAAKWAEVRPPEEPELVPVVVDPADTALFILDIEERTCNEERRPRCLETVPRIAAFLKLAREAGMPVAYSLTSRGTPETIPPAVKPLSDEVIVQASVDKFLGTKLDAFLKDRGIRSVIVCGTAAHGAVLHTATGVGQRKLKLIVPIDGLSASDLYIEQAAVQLLKTGPGTSRAVSLTRFDMISIKR